MCLKLDYCTFAACTTASVLNAVAVEASSEEENFLAKDYATTGQSVSHPQPVVTSGLQKVSI